MYMLRYCPHDEDICRYDAIRVRLPKKMGGEHRGFAFVEFNSGLEAEAAKESLKDLHLYGMKPFHLPTVWINYVRMHVGICICNLY